MVVSNPKEPPPASTFLKYPPTSQPGSPSQFPLDEPSGTASSRQAAWEVSVLTSANAQITAELLKMLDGDGVLRWCVKALARTRFLVPQLEAITKIADGTDGDL
ncbi:hypothetical protein NLI96_g10626 [Meripilus lineatus]|uniref:Uncharacterized protein n=1 Tax=Meripilus lineatus TaxID=2056292 RepID=A0AAD5UUR7_9APHY|nr:hypothetical protein NLI96_g10626 [Physisporinus lineatus]